MERRFEFVDGGSRKFWTIRVQGREHVVTFGRIGTDGQTKAKVFATAAEAKAAADALVREKVGKGYVEQDGTTAVSPKARRPASKLAKQSAADTSPPRKKRGDARQTRALVEAILEEDDGKLALELLAAPDVDVNAALPKEYCGGLLAVAGKGATLIHLAAQHSPRVAIALLERGANPHILDAKQRSPLAYAVAGGHSELIRRLLAEGVAVTRAVSERISQYAYNTSEVGALPDLLAQGADLHMPATLDMMDEGEVATLGAVVRDAPAMLEWLLDRGGDLNWKDKEGRTLLMRAILEGSKAATQVLLRRGADVRPADKNGRTALDVAASEGATDLIPELEKMLNQRASAPLELDPLQARLVAGSDPLDRAKALLELLEQHAVEVASPIRAANDEQSRGVMALRCAYPSVAAATPRADEFLAAIGRPPAYELARLLAAVIPDRVTEIPMHPFASYTERELRQFYPDCSEHSCALPAESGS